MKRIWLVCVVLVLMCLAVSGANAATTHYIDFATGANTNNGTAKGTPWKHAPGMQGCNSNCGSYTPVAGDQFILKGGVTWDHTALEWDWIWSGSSGNVIYIGVDVTWFTGGSFTKPIINGQNTTLATGANSSLIDIESKNWVTFDNIELTGLLAATASGPASLYNYCDTHLTLSNMFIHNWTTTAASDDAHGGVIGNYPGCDPVTNTISNSVISNVEGANAGKQNGVAVRAMGTISGTTIHDVSSAVLFALDFNNSVEYNISYPVANEGFDGVYHYNGVYLDPAAMNDTVGYIRNSIFHDTGGGANQAYVTCRGMGVTCYTYNNLFYGNISSQGAIELDPDTNGTGDCCGTDYTYNNTVILTNSAISTAVHGVSRSGKGTLAVIRNMHVIGTSVTVTDVGTSEFTTVTTSNNLTQTESAATAQGYTSGNSWQPTTGASTIHAGFDDSAQFTTDQLGVARPAGNWDIGAYQFNGGDTTPPAPGSSGTITFSGVSSSAITVNWTKGTDGVTAQNQLQYEVCRSLSNNVSSIANCKAATIVQSYTTDIALFADSSLSGSTSYYYNVLIKDQAGNEALYTANSQATTTAGAAGIGSRFRFGR